MAIFIAKLQHRLPLELAVPCNGVSVIETEVRENGQGPVSYLYKVTDFHDPYAAESCRKIAEQIMQFQGVEIIRNPYQ